MEANIIEALKEYKAIVLSRNAEVAKMMIEYASTEEYSPEYFKGLTPDQRKQKLEDLGERINKTRIQWLREKLGYSGKEMISKPEDILIHWDRFAPLNGLDGAAMFFKDSAERAQSVDAYVRGLRDGLRALGGEAAKLDLPDDFLILLKHVDNLEGHMWQEAKQQDQQVMFFNGIDSYDGALAQVQSPEDFKGDPIYAWGEEDPYPVYVDVTGGWVCGTAPEGGCAVIHGKQESDEEPRWYYYINEGQHGIEVFENLVDLLKWYQEFNVPSDRRVESVLHSLWQWGLCPST